MIAEKLKLIFFVVKDPGHMTLLFHGRNLLLKRSQQNLSRHVLQNIDMDQYCFSTGCALSICCMV